MSNGDTIQRLDIVELRLFIEELACSICRFMHVSQDGVEPQSVRIKQEVQLGTPNAFADIVVRAPGVAGYIVEVDYGYSLERIAESLSRKYQRELGWFKSISKLILIFDLTTIPMTRSSRNMSGHSSPFIGNLSYGTSTDYSNACATSSASM
jgi:hypothetical protein